MFLYTDTDGVHGPGAQKFLFCRRSTQAGFRTWRRATPPAGLRHSIHRAHACVYNRAMLRHSSLLITSFVVLYNSKLATTSDTPVVDCRVKLSCAPTVSKSIFTRTPQLRVPTDALLHLLHYHHSRCSSSLHHSGCTMSNLEARCRAHSMQRRTKRSDAAQHEPRCKRDAIGLTLGKSSA